MIEYDKGRRIMTFSAYLREINKTPKQFSLLTGWHYRSIVSWCKNEPSKFIWTELQRGYLDWLHSGKTTVGPYGNHDEFLKQIVSLIGNRMPRSGKYVGPFTSTKKLFDAIGYEVNLKY